MRICIKMAIKQNHTRKARKMLLKDIFNVEVKCETLFNFHLTTKRQKNISTILRYAEKMPKYISVNK